MLRICLCLLAGCYTLTLATRLPADGLLVVLALVTLGSLPVRQLRPVAAFVLGFLLLCIASRGEIAGRLDPSLSGEDLLVQVRVASFPEVTGGAARFIVEQTLHPDLPRRMRLSWYDPAGVPEVGDTWRLQVRLRRPRGYANPGGFDYEGWLFRQRIGATGYVIDSEINSRLPVPSADRISRLRRDFVRRARGLFPDDQALAVLVAVAVGARHLISREQWDRYAATGTSHLVAISGLHIGLAVGGVFFITRLLLAPLARRRNARDVGIVLATVAAAVYAGISGLAVPARRATIMALTVALAVILRRSPAGARVLGLACMLVVVTDPVSILAPGFTLSFAAVAILIWSANQIGPGETDVRRRGPVRLLVAVRQLFALQIALMFGLFSLTALLFGRSAWLAPLVNLVAVPVFSFVTVPASLAGVLLDGPLQFAGDALLRIAWYSIDLVNRLLQVVGDWPGTLLQIRSLGGPAFVVALLPLLRVVLPAGWPGRELALLAVVATVLHRPDPPPPDCLDMLVMDVGQGQAILLRTHRHTVIFDSGPAFRSGNSAAGLVITPYLRSQGIGDLDLLIVSHADQDHAGGVAALENLFPVALLLSGEQIPASKLPQRRCRAGDRWSRDGVEFELLHPAEPGAWSGNNASCVLEVAVGEHRLLLTGDIEAPVEHHLLRKHALERAETVLVPHHGSRTSSLPGFIERLQPRLAIVSSGFGNRWGFPKDDVVDRWVRSGAVVLNTATSGAIARRYCADSPAGPLSEQRRDRRRYWHEP